MPEFPKLLGTRGEYAVFAMVHTINGRSRPRNPVGTIRHLGIQIFKIELEVLYEGALFNVGPCSI